MSQTFPSGTAVLDPTPLERLRHATEHLVDALHAVTLPVLVLDTTFRSLAVETHQLDHAHLR
ncbi:MAG: hypothetical protein R6W83_04340, partial [Cryobacterium sp.]